MIFGKEKQKKQYPPYTFKVPLSFQEVHIIKTFTRTFKVLLKIFHFTFFDFPFNSINIFVQFEIQYTLICNLE